MRAVAARDRGYWSIARFIDHATELVGAYVYVIANGADSHFMVPDPSGSDVVYEHTLPVTFAGDMMPVAVVAADLSVSTDSRERAAGLVALEEIMAGQSLTVAMGGAALGPGLGSALLGSLVV